MSKQFRTFTIVMLAALTALSSCKVEQPEFKGFSELTLEKVSSKQIVLIGEAHFYNPNGFNMTVKELEIDVDIDGKNIGMINQDFEKDVEGDSDFSLPLRLEFPPDKLYDNILSGIFNIATGKKFEVAYDGYAKAKAFGVSMKIPIKSKKELKLKL